MRLERIKNLNEEMLKIKPDSVGYKIMRDKTRILGFKILNLKLQAMQILKQDAISVGAELVTPRDAILCERKAYDCLLFGSIKSLRLLSAKIQRQPFGLKAISREVKQFLKQDVSAEIKYKNIEIYSLDSKNIKKNTSLPAGKDKKDSKTPVETILYRPKNAKIMAIINVDSNSFYTHFSPHEALDKIYENINLSAHIIDIGAASSQPNAAIIHADDEIKRLDSIFKEVSKIKSQGTKALFSIDTYNAKTAAKALDSGFDIVNDISGNVESMSEILSHYPQASYVLTHIKGSPKDMQNHCNYENLILEINEYFEQKLKILNAKKIKTILDVGIGFAKNAVQNIELITNLAHFKHFRKPLLIGLSHKSFLGKILGNMQQNRLNASIIANFIALQNGAEIIRVHDVKEHFEMLRMYGVFGVDDIDLI